ncbi:hypothetical protein [Phytoactinopolyspora halotolerans]|uniref:PKD domain-containing protein n=1 Tax=Phytoactinopolyspora halotolerans TaxID=1981512 RepID=A0A6L9SHE8_9ACTN|nr:hypothetical protein [Phytoactinopolyspora halotolerans]NEE03741.1 hypothetical protein [Phytoactinopolyspora halotolerans]
MSRKFISLSGAIVLMLYFTVMVVPAHSCGVWGGECPPSPPTPEVDSQGVGYIYDSNTRTFYPDTPLPQGGEAIDEDGVVWMVRYVVRCRTNESDLPGNVMCAEAICEEDGEYGLYVRVYRRESESDPWEPWPGRDRVCQTAGQGAEPIPLANVEAEVVSILEEHYKQITEPEIDVAPAVNAVVNLPVIASTEDPGTVGFDIENPLPGSVEAEPSYAWSWSNGSGGTGPGYGYDGTDPITNPGHYPVHAVYTRSGDGHVDLTATWEVTLYVDGNPPITDIEPLVYTAAETFTVHSARTVLVD